MNQLDMYVISDWILSIIEIIMAITLIMIGYQAWRLEAAYKELALRADAAASSAALAARAASEAAASLAEISRKRRALASSS
jgi:uncharacterized membrane protein YphA (DoxX/SURF4 family)